MNEQLKEWQQKIDALNQRERILIMLTAIAVVVMVLQFLVIDPIIETRDRINNQVKQINSQLQQQKNEQQIISAQLAAGINRSKHRQRDQLNERLAELEKRIESSVVAMIPPRLMPEVLEQVLDKNTGLKLVGVENKPVVPVLQEEASNEVVESERQGLYNHGFILRFEGSYMAAMRYFEKLSELPWKFYWDDLRYRVDSYPNAEIILEVHTVSMSEEWIGV